jgi:hypothetical protein
LTNNDAKNIEEQAEKKTEEQMNENMEINAGDDADCPKNIMQQLQEEFNMSDSEVEGLTKFINSTQNDAMLETLEEMIHCKTLNIRQKVAFAHLLGIFRMEETMSFRIRSSQD